MEVDTLGLERALGVPGDHKQAVPKAGPRCQMEQAYPRYGSGSPCEGRETARSATAVADYAKSRT